MLEKKVFRFRKGQEDWLVWNGVVNFVSEYFLNKRRVPYRVSRLRCDYVVTVFIERTTNGGRT